MESLVLHLCGLWLWITRKSRASHYNKVARTLVSARSYLWSDYTTRASTLDRGTLLAEHAEAIHILERQIERLAETSLRLHSVAECCKLAEEELTQPSQAA